MGGGCARVTWNDNLKKRVSESKRARRWRLRRLFLLIALALMLTTASVPPERAFDLRLAPLLGGQRFDWVGWETGVLLQEAGWWLGGCPLPGDEASQKAEVLAFLDRQRQLAALEDRVRGEVAQLSHRAWHPPPGGRPIGRRPLRRCSAIWMNYAASSKRLPPASSASWRRKSARCWPPKAWGVATCCGYR